MNESSIPRRPLPLQLDHALTDPFWQGTKRHELVLQFCDSCQSYVHFPRERCPVCASQQLTWRRASGRGCIYSFTNVHQPQHPAFQGNAPYCFAIVQLEEGPRLATNIVDCSLESLRCEMRVEAVFEDVSAEVTLVKFRPARE